MSDLPGGAAADDANPDNQPEPEEVIEELDDPVLDEGDGEEPEPLAADDGGQAPLAPPRQRGRHPGRGEPDGDRIRRIEAENATFRQQLQALLQERQQPRQPSPAERAEAERVERERFEMMSPWEQSQYLRQQMQAETRGQLQTVAQALWDQGDRREYEDMLDRHPVVSGMNSRMRQSVEATVEELRAQAPAVPRRILLETAVGRYILANGRAAKTRATNANADQANRNAATPSRAGSDVPGGRARTGRDELVDRLRNVNI